MLGSESKQRAPGPPVALSEEQARPPALSPSSAELGPLESVPSPTRATEPLGSPHLSPPPPATATTPRPSTLPWWARSTLAGPSALTAYSGGTPTSSQHGGRRVLRARPSTPTSGSPPRSGALTSSETVTVASAFEAAPSAAATARTASAADVSAVAAADASAQAVAARQRRRGERIPSLFEQSAPSDGDPAAARPSPMRVASLTSANLEGLVRGQPDGEDGARGSSAADQRTIPQRWGGSASTGRRSRGRSSRGSRSSRESRGLRASASGTTLFAMERVGRQSSSSLRSSRAPAALVAGESVQRATATSPPTLSSARGSLYAGEPAPSQPARSAAHTDAADVRYTFSVSESTRAPSRSNSIPSRRTSAAQDFSTASGAADTDAASASAAMSAWQTPFEKTGGRHGTNASSNPLNIWSHEGGFFKTFFRSGSKSKASDAARSPSDEPLPSPRSPVRPAAADGAHLTSLFATEVSTPTALGDGANALHARHSTLGDLHSSSKDDKRNDNDDDGDGDGGDKGDDAWSSRPSSSLDSSEQSRKVEATRELERLYAARAFRTRNLDALRAFSWDQRVFLPMSVKYLSAWFRLLASPRFWEKLDWSLRAAVLTIMPTLVLCMEQSTSHIFPLPTSVVAYAFWISQPTLGAGLRELYVVLKGFGASLVILIIVIAIGPGPPWLSLILMAVAILVVAFVAEQMKRTCAYVITSLIMQYISDRSATGYRYVGKYILTLLIALGFGLAAFFVPYVRWSSDIASHYIGVMGDSISLSIRGLCGSFWARTPLERQLFLTRLRQLEATAQKSMKKANVAISEMGYEMHTGVYTAHIKSRMAFLKGVLNVVESMGLVIERVTNEPALLRTPMCRAFGERIRGELNLFGAAMDTTLLRITDLHELVTEEDIQRFQHARTRYEDAVSRVREEIILTNEDYRTDYSDVLVGFYLFGVQQLGDLIANYKENPHPPNNLIYFLKFPLRDMESSANAFRALGVTLYRRRTLTRRFKEAIKLAACIVIAAFFQVYAMKNSSTSPVAGVDIIALVYKPTGGESFQYAVDRLLGTVLGSLTGLLAVQIANLRRAVLYVLAVVLCFIGAWVQASPGYFALGNAMCNSVISIVIQFKSQNKAMVRIQQNCFAILCYFVISSVIWPMRARTKVLLGCDISLRMFREAVLRLMQNLDMPESAKEVSADVLSLAVEMGKRVGVQLSNLTGASAEPTLDSAEFPAIPWRNIIVAQQKLTSTLLMMRHAYHTFMTTSVDVGVTVSVHWAILHRISPYTQELGELVFAACDIYLLALSKATMVPTAHLSRIRHGMMRCERKILLVFIEAIQHEVNGDEDSRDSGDGSGPSSDEESDSWGRSDYGSAGGRRGVDRANSQEWGLSARSVADDAASDSAREKTDDLLLSEGGQQQQQQQQQPRRRRRKRTVGGSLDGAISVHEDDREDHAACEPAPKRTDAPAANSAPAVGAKAARVDEGLATRRAKGCVSYKLSKKDQETLRALLANASFLDSEGLANNSFILRPPAVARDRPGTVGGASVGEDGVQDVDSLLPPNEGSSRGSHMSETYRPPPGGVSNRTLVGPAMTAHLANNSSIFLGRTNNATFAGRDGTAAVAAAAGASGGVDLFEFGLSARRKGPAAPVLLPPPALDADAPAAPRKATGATDGQELSGLPEPVGTAARREAVAGLVTHGDLLEDTIRQHSTSASQLAAAMRSVADETTQQAEARRPGSTAAADAIGRAQGRPPGRRADGKTATQDGPLSALSLDSEATPLPLPGTQAPATDSTSVFSEASAGAALRGRRAGREDPLHEDSGTPSASETLPPAAAPLDVSAHTVATLPAQDSRRRRAGGSATSKPDEPTVDTDGAVADSDLNATAMGASIYDEPVNDSLAASPARRRRLSALFKRVKKNTEDSSKSKTNADERDATADPTVYEPAAPDILSQTLNGSNTADARAKNKRLQAFRMPHSSTVSSTSYDYDEDSSSGDEATNLLDNADRLMKNLTFFDPAQGEMVLTNQDIHSLEAFLFGIRSLVAQVDELEQHFLAMIHENEMARKL